eukprot:evm.model.scf_1162.1 EVM.evm.TU.scf_1162.1   scf_1162:1987-5016(+)
MARPARALLRRLAGCVCSEGGRAFLLGAALTAVVTNLLCGLNGCLPPAVFTLGPTASSRSSPAQLAVRAPRARDTLVLYTFAPSNPEYEDNLAYFVRHAVDAEDRRA